MPSLHFTTKQKLNAGEASEGEGCSAARDTQTDSPSAASCYRHTPATTTTSDNVPLLRTRQNA